MCVCVLQTCIVTHESNGIDIITALILNDISPLCRYRMEMVLELKVNAACRGPCGSITPPVGGHTWLSDCFFFISRLPGQRLQAAVGSDGESS